MSDKKKKSGGPVSWLFGLIGDTANQLSGTEIKTPDIQFPSFMEVVKFMQGLQDRLFKRYERNSDNAYHQNLANPNPNPAPQNAIEAFDKVVEKVMEKLPEEKREEFKADLEKMIDLSRNGQLEAAGKIAAKYDGILNKEDFEKLAKEAKKIELEAGKKGDLGIGGGMGLF